ncbi:MAG: hypothetical protein ACYS8X_07970 [Planctomycetota bacterium]|jgi:hypothetical protein
MASGILAERPALAGELGAEQIELSCPGDLDLDGDIVDRQFGFAWPRKRL